MYKNNPKFTSIILEFLNLIFIHYLNITFFLLVLTTFATTKHPLLKISMEFHCGSNVWFMWTECFEISLHPLKNV